MQRLDEVSGLGMVANMAGVVDEADDAVPVDDEGPRHLKYVADGLLDVMTFSCRLHPSHESGWPEHFQHRSPLETEGLVTRTAWIGKAWEGHLETITQRLRLLWVALRDCHNVATSGFDLLGARTELRQVLPTEWSAEVPKKCYDDGSSLPEIGERDLAPMTAAELRIGRWLARFKRHV